VFRLHESGRVLLGLGRVLFVRKMFGWTGSLRQWVGSTPSMTRRVSISARQRVNADGNETGPVGSCLVAPLQHVEAKATRPATSAGG